MSNPNAFYALKKSPKREVVAVMWGSYDANLNAVKITYVGIDEYGGRINGEMADWKFFEMYERIKGI